MVFFSFPNGDSDKPHRAWSRRTGDAVPNLGPLPQGGLAAGPRIAHFGLSSPVSGRIHSLKLFLDSTNNGPLRRQSLPALQRYVGITVRVPDTETPLTLDHKKILITVK
jgi:hypothetical protein